MTTSPTAALAQALGGRRAHEDRAPSLSIADGKGGKVLVCCHAGCDQREVIVVLRDRGLWETAKATGRFACTHHRRIPSAPDPNALNRTETALAVWRASQPAKGTPVENYLRSRLIDLPVPAALRFHAELKHCSGGIWPVMVALVTRGVDREPIGIHRTLLAGDGNGKAPVDSVKMMLGSCRGGVVRLGESSEPVMVSEGIETCLAAMQATGEAAWAALSTSGLCSLSLPRDACWALGADKLAIDELRVVAGSRS